MSAKKAERHLCEMEVKFAGQHVKFSVAAISELDAINKTKFKLARGDLPRVWRPGNQNAKIEMHTINQELRNKRLVINVLHFGNKPVVARPPTPEQLSIRFHN